MFVKYGPSRILRAAAVSALFVFVTTSLLMATDASQLTWKKVRLTHGPSARALFASAYDPVSRKIVIFGGTDANTRFGETWTFDGTTWAQVKTNLAPSARSAASMAYDYHIHKLILFGGTSGFARFNDTWLWDGETSTWTPANPKTVPPGASGPVLFSDPSNGRVIMFGGNRGQFYSRDTYRWTGADWRLLSPSVTPYPRSGAVVGYDPNQKKEVLFGGISDNWVVQNTWTWDGSNWTQENPSTQPPPLYWTAGGFYPPVNAVVVFGGGSEGVDQDTTWAWTGTDWTQLSPSKSPAAREGMGLVGDPASRQFLAFGGTDFDSGTYFADVWKLIGQ